MLCPDRVKNLPDSMHSQLLLAKEIDYLPSVKIGPLRV